MQHAWQQKAACLARARLRNRNNVSASHRNWPRLGLDGSGRRKPSATDLHSRSMQPLGLDLGMCMRPDYPARPALSLLSTPPPLSQQKLDSDSLWPQAHACTTRRAAGLRIRVRSLAPTSSMMSGGNPTDSNV
eukprot:361603-Chlamydomonas_euryale.AAC.7